MKRRGISILISLSMIFSVLVAPVIAATTTETIFSNNTYSTQGIRSVDYVSDLGIYVATGGSAVYTSADGNIWSRRAELDWNGGLAIAGFAYGNNHGILIDASANGSYRAIITDKYLNESWNATMVVEHDANDDNVLEDANGAKYRYLKIKPKIYFDNATSKFYCFGIENTASGQWKDWGIYSSDGTIESVDSGLYGNNNTSAIKWTKVNLGAADPFAGKTASDSVVPTSFQIDGHGRMIFTVETQSVGYWSGNYRGETVLVDLVNDKALNYYNARVISPRAGIDSDGNFITVGNGYGNYSANITAYGGSVDTMISTYCASESYRKMEIGAANVGMTWSTAQYTAGATGTDSTGADVKMAVKPRKFVSVSGGIMAIPNGTASIADGKENDLKVYLQNGSGVLDGTTKYKTVINNAEKLAQMLGNGGTARTVIDACTGPNGQIVLATAIVTDTVKNTQSNIVVLETDDIDFTATPVNNASRAEFVTSASKDYGAVKNIQAEETQISQNGTTTITATVLDGSRAVVNNPNIEFLLISKDDGINFDAETGTITATEETGAFNLTVKVLCANEPSVYAVKDISIVVGEAPYTPKVQAAIFSEYNTWRTQGIRSIDYVSDLGIYVATGGSAVYTSADGYLWSKRAEVDWNNGLEIAAFAYGNGHGILSDGSTNNSYYRAAITDQYLNSSWGATMVVGHNIDDTDVLTASNGTKYRYLKIKPKIYFDNATGKFYCFGIENTGKDLWKDWGIYSSDGTIESVDSGLYGNTNTSAIKWTKVDLGAADPFAEKTASDSIVPTSFQIDGHGRMIFTVETQSVGYWSGNYRGETVLVDLVNDKALNYYNARVISPRAGIDSDGNFITVGNGYGNYSANVTAYGGSFDTMISTYCASESHRKMEIGQANVGMTWSTAQYTTGATGTNSAGSDVKMAVKPSKFVAVSGGIMAIPNGTAAIADGKENDLKVYLQNGSGVLDGTTKYKTVINNAEKLAQMLGNGGTARTVIDACAGPDGQIVLATAIVTDNVKNTQSNIVVLETNDIDYATTPVDNGSNAKVIINASKDYGAVKNVGAEAEQLLPNSSTTITYTVTDGTRTEVNDPDVAFELISKDNGINFDAETGTITATDETGIFNLTVKVLCANEPSVYTVKRLEIDVDEPIVTILNVNGTDYDIKLAQAYDKDDIPVLMKGENTFTFTSSRKVAKSYSDTSLAVALYLDNVLIDLAVDHQEVQKGKSFRDFDGTLNVPSTADLNKVTLKVFAWETSLEPIWTNFAIHPIAKYTIGRNMNYITFSDTDETDIVELYDHDRIFKTLQISHGTLDNGKKAEYIYAVLPNSTKEEANIFMSNPTVEVIKADSSQHTIKDLRTGAILSNVFTAPVTVNNEITVETPCSLIVKKNGTQYIIDISDPTQKVDTISLSFPEAVTSIVYDNVYQINNKRITIQTKHTGETLHLVVSQ